jgi:hypothetical protein
MTLLEDVESEADDNDLSKNTPASVNITMMRTVITAMVRTLKNGTLTTLAESENTFESIVERED